MMPDTTVLIHLAKAGSLSTDDVIRMFERTNDLGEIKRMVESAEERLYTTWSTVDAVDKDGEKVPIDEAINQHITLLKRGGPVTDNHSNTVVGKTLSFKVLRHPETETYGILQLNKIYADNPSDDTVWSEMKSGKRKGSSVGGGSMKSTPSAGEDGVFNLLEGYWQYETANCDSPANQYALHHAMSAVAKAEKVTVINQDSAGNNTTIMGDLQMDAKELSKTISEAVTKSVTESTEALAKRLDEIEKKIDTKKESSDDNPEEPEKKPMDEEKKKSEPVEKEVNLSGKEVPEPPIKDTDDANREDEGVVKGAELKKMITELHQEIADLKKHSVNKAVTPRPDGYSEVNKSAENAWNAKAIRIAKGELRPNWRELNAEFRNVQNGRA